MTEEPTGQAASEKQSLPVQLSPSTIQEVPQHVVDAKIRAGNGSAMLPLEAFWLEAGSSATMLSAVLMPAEVSELPDPRNEG
jgi:hypothetical protein